MTRTAEHPSGPKRTICLALAPDHADLLRSSAAARGISMSNLVAKLIDRALTPREIDVHVSPDAAKKLGINPEPPADLSGVNGVNVVCSHSGTTKRIISGGLIQLTCNICKATKTGNGPWVTP